MTFSFCFRKTNRTQFGDTQKSRLVNTCIEQMTCERIQLQYVLWDGQMQFYSFFQQYAGGIMKG